MVVKKWGTSANRHANFLNQKKMTATGNQLDKPNL